MKPLLATLVLAAGCGPKCPEPQYEGKASDEAYLTLLDGEASATVDAAKAPNLQGVDGMTFSAGTVQTFRWTSTLSASTLPPAPRPSPRALPRPPWYRDLLLSTAWAHLPPVTGSIFWLKFTVPGEKCPLEVLTTSTLWTPTAALWATLSKGQGPRSVAAYSAYLVENRITEGEFKLPSAVTFTVSP